MTMEKRLYGALEAGGTKMVCAVGYEDGTITDRVSIPTTTPDETMRKIIGYFKDKDVAAVGVGCFGPVDLDPASDTWGYILDTPKLAWRHFDMAGTLKEALSVEVGFDTDVNGSLLGETTFGSSRGLSDVVYITIGTGIGAGIMSGGKLVHGMLHPEAGHVRIVPRQDDDYEGKCPYHGRCFEGMASGPAIEARWGKPAALLADRDEVWDLEAYYIAGAVSDLIMVLSPQRIILGGGVMHQTQLFPRIRSYVLDNIGGYINTKALTDMDNYIVPPSLGDDQGIMGAIELARRAEER